MDNESWMAMPEPRNNIAEELEKYLMPEEKSVTTAGQLQARDLSRG